MASVYILFSEQLNSFYIGSCEDLAERLEEHLSGKYKQSYTAKATDWKYFLVIENLAYRQCREIELHIKRMKSRKYINDLLKYPEIIEKLKLKYI
jgi:putative endonuclease